MSQDYDDTDAMLNEMMARGCEVQSSAVQTQAAFSGYLFCNPDTGIEWNSQHPIDSGECEDATDIHLATFPRLISSLQEAWQALAESEDQRLQDIKEAEARGAEEQRRKDAEAQVPVAWIFHARLRGTSAWRTFVDTNRPEENPSNIRNVSPLYDRPANVSALEARVKMLEGDRDRLFAALRTIASTGGATVGWMRRTARAALTREGGV